MSGPPILPIALRIVYETSISQPKPVIGVGGIEKGEDAIKFFMTGASLVQICSGALKKGSAIYGTVSQEIEEWLEKHGYSSIDDVQNKYIDAVKHLRH
ncbi:Dihydroorotate dehydrogenase A (fumarate) [bioreactor metagenome]|uniref:Dihydroorotate dehydrogenase A (Fumarate) n=2 Tax=root TaxID=1 RepID=A0A645FD42_9ZZZZ